MRPDTMPPVGALVLVHTVQPTITEPVQIYDPPYVAHVIGTVGNVANVMIKGKRVGLTLNVATLSRYADSWEVMP